MDFVTYIADEQTGAVVQSVIDAHVPSGVLLPGGSKAALASVSGKVRLPRMVVIDISDDPDEAAAASAILKAFAESQAVILLGQQDHISFYRQMLALGAADYLAKPFSADELLTAMRNASVQTHDRQDVRPSLGKRTHARLVVVMSAHGGAGTSTLIANTGWILAEEQHQKTVLIDLDVHFGVLALLMDVKPSIGFRDALESPSRIDTDFVESLLVKKTPQLSILSAEETLDHYVVFNGAAMELLIESIRENRDFILVDAPRSVLRRCEQVIERADIVAVVSEMTVIGLRNARDIRVELYRNFPNAQVHLILNKQRGKDVNEVDPEEFQKIGFQNITMIPDEPDVFIKAVNDGLPLSSVKKNGRSLQALRHMCATFTGATPSEEVLKPVGLLGKLGQLSAKSKRSGS